MTLEDKIRELKALPTPPNEESAKNQLIQPVLRLLGWPSDDPAHVAFEHHIGGGHVDIALRGKDHFVAFLEAKAPGKSLDSAVEQVLGYAFHGGVDICVLTTGIEWWLYLPREKGPPQERRFAVLNVANDQPVAVAEGLRRYVGREALASGAAESSAKDALKELRRIQTLRVEIPKVWQKMKRGPDSELLSLIQRRVQTETKLKADASLVAEVLGMDKPDEALDTPNPSVTDGGGEPTQGGHQPRPATVHPKPSAWRLWGDETPASTSVEVLVGVFKAVYRRHKDGFIEAARPLWGKHTPWISSDPTGWRQSKPIGEGGLHVNSSLSAVNINQEALPQAS